MTLTYEYHSLALLHFKIAMLEESAVLIAMRELLYSQGFLAHSLNSRKTAGTMCTSCGIMGQTSTMSQRIYVHLCSLDSLQDTDSLIRFCKLHVAAFRHVDGISSQDNPCSSMQSTRSRCRAYVKVRFLGTNGFSTRPSSFMVSRAFSAAAALPDCAPPDKRWIISVCSTHAQT